MIPALDLYPLHLQILGSSDRLKGQGSDGTGLVLSLFIRRAILVNA